MPRSVEVISQWHHSVENLSTSALEWYASIETALKEKGSPVHVIRLDWLESGLLSSKRTYLRLSYARYSVDISAFPFGKDFYFGWWLVKRLPSGVLLWGCATIAFLPILFLGLLATLGIVKGFMFFVVACGVGWVILQGMVSDGGSGVEDAILATPGIGFLYQRFVRPATYYSEDTRIMFEETVHRVITDAVAAVLVAHRLPPLTPEEARVRPRSNVPS